MKKLLTGLLLAAVIFGSLSVTAYAHGPQGRFAGNADRYNRRAENFGIGYRQIEMTDSQLEKIDEFRTEFFEETEELRDNMRELNWEIRDLYMTDAEAEEIEAVEAELE